MSPNLMKWPWLERPLLEAAPSWPLLLEPSLTVLLEEPSAAFERPLLLELTSGLVFPELVAFFFEGASVLHILLRRVHGGRRPWWPHARNERSAECVHLLLPAGHGDLRTRVLCGCESLRCPDVLLMLVMVVVVRRVSI